MAWPDDTIASMRAALEPLADPQKAPQMQRYMKDVAPFLGINSGPRRAAQRNVLRRLPEPRPEHVIVAARRLYALAEREYHYSAISLLGHYRRLLPADVLAGPVAELLTTKPWWDTVDDFGGALITPFVALHPELVSVMWDWNGTDDQWLIRASIQHQRGRKKETDVDLVIALCEPHATDRRFFVAKAIGWALRDLTGIDPGAVRTFITNHPDLPRVARREADRGLLRL